MLPCIVFASSAYRDTYQTEIQREIFHLDNEIKRGSATQFEKKRKKYLEKRLKKIQTVGVARIAFTTLIKKREPLNSITSVSYRQNRVYLFTEIENMRGRRVTHIWYYNNKQVYKKRFKIRGTSWRIWTSKKITKYMVGDWKVVVVDGSGKILTTKHLQVTD